METYSGYRVILRFNSNLSIGKTLVIFFQFNRMKFEEKNNHCRLLFCLSECFFHFSQDDFGVGASARGNKCIPAHLIFNFSSLKNERTHRFSLFLCLAFSPNPQVFPIPPLQPNARMCVCMCGCVRACVGVFAIERERESARECVCACGQGSRQQNTAAAP